VSFYLVGYDTFSAEYYRLGDSRFDGMQPSYATRDAALEDARKRLAELERTQPSASSGGQSGIQDRVYIVHPDGYEERVLT
jgi:hypothetical protein